MLYPFVLFVSGDRLKVDLPQVDLASEASLLGREAAVRATKSRGRVTKSREVDLSRLKGFRLRFAPKMGIIIFQGVEFSCCVTYAWYLGFRL